MHLQMSTFLNFPNLHCAAIRFMQCPRVSRRSDTPTRLEARATSTAIASPNLIVVMNTPDSGRAWNSIIKVRLVKSPGGRKSRVVLTTHPGLGPKSRVVLTTHPGLARKSRVVLATHPGSRV